MKILAIETSCDDTGVAILEVKSSKVIKFQVLSNVVSSQIEVHKKYGGVFPMMAKREHQHNLLFVLKKALKESKLLKISNSKFLISNKTPPDKFQKIRDILERESELLKQLLPFLTKYDKPDVDLIAVTSGPGLEPCLWVGVNFAKALSYFWDIPIVPVNHIESHILVNFLSTRPGLVDFPAVALVVSGGHTQLILMKGIGKYKIIGETRDDAAGECFDKCAKILGLGYPGGHQIAKFASQWKSEILNPKSKSQNSKLLTTHYSLQTKLPRPMINTKDYDFSFSGLKTAVLYSYQKSKIKNQKYIQEMCFEIQRAILDVLIKKTIKAAKDYKTKTIILGGGVSANTELRKQFSQKLEISGQKLNFLVPPKNLSTDNALMIAVTGYFYRTKKIAWQKLFANANLRVGK